MSGKLSTLFLLAIPLAFACGDKDDDTGSEEADADTDADTDADMANGEEVFGNTCAYCHGDAGNNGDAPDLYEKVPTHDEASLSEVIKNGTGYMNPVDISDEEIADVVSYALYTFE